MQHLSLESLARLVDEAPSRDEALHLETCSACRAELEEMRGQTRALSALADPPPPPAAWPLLARRLRAEGLLAGRGNEDHAWLRPLVSAAAALALFLGGGAAGAALLGGGAAEGGSPTTPVAAVRVEEPRTAQEAALQLRRAESEYLAALTRYAELTGASESVDPVNRLAALEGIVLTTRAALQEAPADPLINGYHLTALGQRDAILRQISQTGEDAWF